MQQPDAYTLWNKQTGEWWIGPWRWAKDRDPAWMCKTMAAINFVNAATFTDKKNLRMIPITKSKHWESDYRKQFESGELELVNGYWRNKK